MKKAILIRTVLITLAALVISSAVSVLILQYSKEKEILRGMGEILDILTCADPQYNIADMVNSMENISTDYRLTVIRKDGTVLADSLFPAAEMENHLDRVEVQAAWKTGTGTVKRSSETYGEKMFYYAKRSGDEIYRISHTANSLDASMWDMLPALLAGILVSLMITPFLAGKTAESVARPLTGIAGTLEQLRQGDSYGMRIQIPSGYDEIDPIVGTINSLTHEISENLNELSNQKCKTEYLLSNIQEGLVLLDYNLNILQCNTAAQLFFEAKDDVTGKNLTFLTHNIKVLDNLQKAVEKGRASLFDLDLTASAGMILTIRITPVLGGWQENGKESLIIMLIQDVTNTRQIEKMRSDFVANVSHELKTPITSIRGFAELLASGMVSDPARTQDFLERILSESSRMTGLIDDILRLSTLENREEPPHLVPVDMEKLVTDICLSMTPQIHEKEITLTVTGGGIVYAKPEDLLQMVRNLIDNALKYNVQGGSVIIKMNDVSNRFKLSVKDTGIGIPAEHQSRIFERFYRVDKARSRKVGGTGLGLSIVKHIVAKYSGEIFLTSKEGKGTKISIILPCTQPES